VGRSLLFGGHIYALHFGWCHWRGQDKPLVAMLPRWGGAVVGAWWHGETKPGDDVRLWGAPLLTVLNQSGDSMSLTRLVLQLSRFVLSGRQFRLVVHRMWRPLLWRWPLRWRAVRQTPTYDQLRGERINADVPASKVDPDRLDCHGRHHLQDDAPVAPAVCGPLPGPRREQAEDWSGFGTGGVDRPGKHRLRDHAPAAAVCGPSLGPETDPVEGWSWFGQNKPGRADLADTTPAAPG
jgi:hypothetical protein